MTTTTTLSLRSDPKIAASPIPRHRQIIRFLGRRVTALLAVGVFIGLSLFVVEVAFAYGLQAFLVCLDIMPKTTVAMPAWLSGLRLDSLRSVLGYIFVVGLLRGLLNWAQIYSQGAAAEKFRHLCRFRLLRWAFQSESVSTYEVTSLFERRVSNATAVINAVQGLAVQLTSGVMIMGSLVWLSPRLSTAMAVAMGVLLLPLRVADRKILQASLGQDTAMVQTSRRLIKSIKNLLLIQIYMTQNIEERKAQSTLDDHYRHALRLHLMSGFKFALPQLAGVILICIITIIARHRGGMAPGLLVSYFYLVMRLLQVLSTVNIAFALVASYRPDTQYLYHWWQHSSHDGPSGGKAQGLELAPRPADASPVGWRLDGVSFAYPEAEKPVMRDLSLRLEPGQTLAITGPSGSGKSTLLNIMLGGIKPSTGTVEAVLPGGATRPLQSYRSELLPIVGYVGPESFMVEGTILDNLTYGLQHEPGRAEIAEALGKAECAFVGELANGLDYPITEQGQGLSAGQKQRLALARALLRSPKVLILDEATSNLDNETEEKLVETLSKLKSEMTIIAATHRQALLRIADQRVSLE